MNVKLLLYVTAGIAVTGLVWLGSNASVNQETGSSQGRLVAAQSEFDFGEVSMAGGVVRHSFRVVNDGTEDVVIGKVYTSCMCTEAYVEGKGPFGMPGHGGLSKADHIIRPGEEIVVEAVFDPAAHGPAGAGMAQRVIYVETNSIIKPRLSLEFTAYVTK